MSVDPETKKPRLVKITYWESFAFCVIIGLLFPRFPQQIQNTITCK